MCHKPISELSPELQEIARKNERLLLTRLSEIGQKEVGEKVGISESSMSKLKSEGRIEFFLPFRLLCLASNYLIKMT